MDPISVVLAAGAAGGAASKVSEVLIEYLHDLLRGQSQEAKRRAADNTRAFLGSLAERIAHLEGRSGLPLDASLPLLADSLDDPDFTLLFRDAAIAAARTADPFRHGLLARAVAERLRAAPHSVEALASTMAVDVLPHLANTHLQYLGLLALLLHIRPPGIPLSKEPPPEVREPANIAPYEKDLLVSYNEWLGKSLAFYRDLPTLTASDYAHLLSTGCATIDHTRFNDLDSALSPAGQRLLSVADAGGTWAARREILWTTVPGLYGLWRDHLQHQTLTPVGVLIGCSVHSSLSGWQGEVVLSDLSMVQAYPPQPLMPWTNDGIDRDFLSILESKVREWFSEWKGR